MGGCGNECLPARVGKLSSATTSPIVVGHDVRCAGGGRRRPGEDLDPPLLGQTQSSWTAAGAGVMTPRGSTLLSVTTFPIENSSTEASNIDIAVAIAAAVDPLLPLHRTHLSSIRHDQLGVAAIVVAAMVAIHE